LGFGTSSRRHGLDFWVSGLWLRNLDFGYVSGTFRVRFRVRFRVPVACDGELSVGRAARSLQLLDLAP
jgi:hypothetical protein